MSKRNSVMMQTQNRIPKAAGEQAAPGTDLNTMTVPVEQLERVVRVKEEVERTLKENPITAFTVNAIGNMMYGTYDLTPQQKNAIRGYLRKFIKQGTIVEGRKGAQKFYHWKQEAASA
jgi:hypothetical protein